MNGGAQANLIPQDAAIAVVKPVFTSTPYAQYPTSSFYAFFKKYLTATGNITSDLGLLNTSIREGMGYNSGWGHTLPLYDFLSSAAARNCGLMLGKNVMVTSDINVSQGALFAQNGSRRFGAVIIGHEEYVTQAEFDQLRLFVASGGRLIAMSSNMFYAKVAFDPGTQAETFIVGHGYAFNGRSAWRSGISPFNSSMKVWFGSTYCCFRRFTYAGGAINLSNPIGSAIAGYVGRTMALSYASHEENAVSNFTRTSIVATFINQSRIIVASYVHDYGRGAVFCLCIFGEAVVSTDLSTQLFLLLSVTANISGPTGSSLATPAITSGQVVVGVGLAVTAVVVVVAAYLNGRREARLARKKFARDESVPYLRYR